MDQGLVEKRKIGEENKETTPEKQGKQTIRTNKEKCYICSKAMEIGTVGWKIEARNNKKRGSFSYQRWIHIECWNEKEKEEVIKNTSNSRVGRHHLALLCAVGKVFMLEGGLDHTALTLGQVASQA